MKIQSPAFEENGFIPSRYTCEGEEVIPIAINNFIFKRVKTPKINERKWHSINSIQCHLRSLIYRQFSRSLNMKLFIAIGISPPLEFINVPKNAKSLCLLVDDPDVPKSLRSDGMWDHWVLFNILPTVQKIEENKTPLCISGMTTSGSTSYVGPCPPDRQHRYFFKLYALDTMLKLPSGATKSEVEKAMQGHILAESQLIGLYEKGKE